MFSVLTEYSFWTVALGAACLSLAASMIGTISVLTKQSLIGDSLSHASYPGIVFSYMLFQSRHPTLLLLGAIFAGYCSYGLVLWIQQHSKQSLTTILALVASCFFGLGMVLKQYVQGNHQYQNASQAGLKNYLFGQSAFIQKEDVLLISAVSFCCLFLFFLSYQSFKLYLFDEAFALTVGVPVRWLKRLTMFLMICLIAVGLKVAGAVLMSNFLIAPAVWGLLFGKTYPQTLCLASLMALISAFFGTWLSSMVSGLSTGPSMIVCMTFFISLAFLYVTYVKKENRRA